MSLPHVAADEPELPAGTPEPRSEPLLRAERFRPDPVTGEQREADAS